MNKLNKKFKQNGIFLIILRDYFKTKSDCFIVPNFKGLGRAFFQGVEFSIVLWSLYGSNREKQSC